MSLDKQNHRKRKRWLLIPILLVVAYAAVLGWFKMNEDSFVYIPRKGLRNADSINIGIERVTLTTADCTKLVAWIIPAQCQDTSACWVLYFHGNGGNISSRGYVAHFKTFRSMNINTFALDYRGYGLSEGTPSESNLYGDAKTAFDYLVNVRHVTPRNIVLFGYSLGSGVATELATQIDAGGVILEGAFTSLPDAGFAKYPFLPTNLMMKNRFDSVRKIEMVAEPKLFLHSKDDEIIPYRLGQTLFERAPKPKTFVTTIGGHEAAHTQDSTNFYNAIAQFLSGLKR
jgi:fermentation-respiration switch protein FrsA (DUF1100 family)